MRTTTSKYSIPKGAEAPTITIDPICEAKIHEWVRLCDKEISGLGKVIVKPDGTFHVNSVYLLTQEVSSAETEINDEAVASLLFESRMDEGEMTFWWHSHVNMAVFWSGTDMDTIYQFGSKGALISAVYNKQGERRVSFYVQGNGYHPTTFLDELPMRTTSILTDEHKAYCKKEFDDKVTESKGFYTGGQYFDDLYEDDYILGTAKYTAKFTGEPKEKVKIISYNDKTMEKWGLPKHLINHQRHYYQLVLTKWHDLSIPKRKDWARMYYRWHETYAQPKELLQDNLKVDYAEFADSFDWDLTEAARYCTDTYSGGVI